MTQALTRAFARALYAPASRTGGYVCVSVVHAGVLAPVFVPIGQDFDDRLAEVIDAVADAGADVYLSAGVLDERPAAGRGGAKDHRRITSVWADVDIAGPGHKETMLAATSEQAIDVACGLVPGIQPSCIVHTGGGIQAWWFLDREADGDLARDLLAGMRRSARDHARQCGVRIDAVFNPDRLMRAPGTVNNKIPGQPRHVEVLWLDPDNRTSPEALCARLPGPDAEDAWEPAGDGAEPTGGTGGLVEWWEARRPDPGSVLTEAGFHSPKASGRGTVLWLRAGVTWEAHPNPSAEVLADGKRVVVYTSTLPDTATDQHLGQPRRPYELWVDLIHGGDWSVAWRQAAEARRAEQAEQLKQEMAERYRNGAARSTGATGDAMRVHTAPDGIGLDDEGNARRFVMLRGDELRWTDAGAWYACDPLTHVWVSSTDDSEAMRRTETVGRLLGEQADDLQQTDGAQAKRVAAWARASKDLPRKRAMTQLAKAHLVTSVDTFDAWDEKIATQNGLLLDLRAMQARALRPDDMAERVTGVVWDPDADMSEWEQRLDEWFLGDVELIDAVQQVIGSGLLGFNPNQVLPVCIGVGANGKSVFVDVVAHAMGEYARPIDGSLLLRAPRTNDEKHPASKAWLRGVRFGYVNEMSAGETLNSESVKELCSGGKIVTRQLYGQFFETRLRLTPVLVLNQLPDVRETDEGIWRRLFVIPFDARISPDAQDPYLTQTLTEQHGPAVLRWLAEGAHKALTRPTLRRPERSMVQTREWRDDEDAVAEAFAAAGFRITGNDYDVVAKRDLVERVRIASMVELSPKRIGAWVRAHGAVARADRRSYQGIRWEP